MRLILRLGLGTPRTRRCFKSGDLSEKGIFEVPLTFDPSKFMKFGDWFLHKSFEFSSVVSVRLNFVKSSLAFGNCTINVFFEK